MSARVWLLLSVILLASLGGLISAQPPAPTTFTGNVNFMETPDLGPVRIHFDPGARTYWHTHSGWQVLVAEDGRGRTQIEAGAMQELLPGQPVFAPGGVPHWHGAAPDEALTQVTLNKGDVNWLGPVSDDQYRGASSLGSFGPEIQFDTRGADFGSWVRAFMAQVKRNWFIPLEAKSLAGHVAITFDVHKDGTITDIVVVPSSVEAFNHSASAAARASSPAPALPPDYPMEKVSIKATFFYNEKPPSGRHHDM